TCERKWGSRMPKQTLIEQLNQMIDAIIDPSDNARREQTVDSILGEVDPVVAELSGIVGDLRSLPSENFKSALKVELMGSAGVTGASDVGDPRAGSVVTPDAVLRDPVLRDSFMLDAVAESPAKYESSKQKRSVMSKAAPASTTSGVLVYLRCRRAEAAIEFYKKAFGAIELMRLQSPDGRIGHAELSIANTVVKLADEHPEYNVFGPETLGGSSVGLHLYVDDVDAVTQRAIAAGAKVIRP